MSGRIDPALIPAQPDLQFEHLLWQQGFHTIAGLDEAGRGAWAGPVAAAAVVLPCDDAICATLKGVRDSKELAPQKRAGLAPIIKASALAWGVGMSSAAEIDEIGILWATRLAMQRALDQLTQIPDHLLIDALFLLDNDSPQTALYKGDQRCLSIAAASILAKTSRDEWMVQQDAVDGRYGYCRHKGYGTAWHQQQLALYGPGPLHRRSFEPIAQLIAKPGNS
ncbi:MAG: ribonuclease HII [Anaerolineaceae bacterium]|nr:ribonuclease HII [Anaerolineaceae bacterium]